MGAEEITIVGVGREMRRAILRDFNMREYSQIDVQSRLESRVPHPRAIVCMGARAPKAIQAGPASN